MWTNSNLNNVAQALNLFFSDKLKENNIDPSIGIKTIEEKTRFEEIVLQYLMVDVPHDTQGGTTRYVLAHFNDKMYTLQYTRADHQKLVRNSYLVVLFNGEIIHTCVFDIDHPLCKLSFLLDSVIETTSKTNYSQYMTQPQSNGYQFMSGYGQGYSQPTHRRTNPNVIELLKEDVDHFISFEKTSEYYIAGVNTNGELVILGANGFSEEFVIPEVGSITHAYSVFIKGCKDHEELPKNNFQHNGEFRTLLNDFYNLSGYHAVSFHRFTF